MCLIMIYILVRSIGRDSQKSGIHFALLGRVDELFDDNPHGDEMNQSQKGLTQFLIPRGNAPKLLEVVEEPFHLLTELVEVFIIV